MVYTMLDLCSAMSLRGFQHTQQKSKLIWQLYSTSTSNSKQNIFSTDGTPEAQAQGHRLAKRLHPRVQNSLNSAELRKVNQYLYERIGFQQIHDAFNEQFLQNYMDICMY